MQANRCVEAPKPIWNDRSSLLHVITNSSCENERNRALGALTSLFKQESERADLDPRVVRLLLKLISDSDSLTTQSRAAGALANAAKDLRNRDECVRSLGVRLLVHKLELVGDQHKAMQARCAAVLINICKDAANWQHIVDEGGVQKLLIAAQRRTSRELTCHCLRVLACLLEIPSVLVSFQSSAAAALVLCEELLHDGTRDEKEQAVLLLTKLHSRQMGCTDGLANECIATQAVMTRDSFDQLVQLLDATESEKCRLTVIKAIGKSVTCLQK